MKKVLSKMNLQELEEFCLSIGQSKFRARQIYNWVYLKSVKNIDDMTDLSKRFREELKELAIVSDVKIAKKQVSSDGTVKFLLEFPDGEKVETVLMRFDNRANLTACVSSQVGCAMGCAFCATGKRGFIRNLTPYEIINQVLAIQMETGLKVTNIVFMGQGEPLLNLDNVLEAMRIFNDCFQIGVRRMTVSTCGVVPKINKLAEIGMQSTLAISLHAPTHVIREKIMPVEKKYDIDLLKKTLLNYTEKTGRRVTIEYILIGGLNDTPQCAKDLAYYLDNLNCNINLIVYNPVAGDSFKRPKKEDIYKFKYLLETAGKKVTIRLERGLDIDAACGQLSGKA
ncbi:23S rRNA (adenine(2503)-C(2))-methyltransferase RlmN [bacterium]|nr:23S rRNA (adenine(2503)-C(2))-methyltransferase RlmN [bacterium]